MGRGAIWLMLTAEEYAYRTSQIDPVLHRQTVPYNRAGRPGGNMAVEYGVATYDRWNGMVRSDLKLPLTGVRDGGFIEFLESAGENGWELCGSFPSGTKGHKVAQTGKTELKETLEPTEYITFIFKKV